MPTVGLKSGFHPPRRTGTIGMYLFLAALFMLFASSLLAYVFIRTQSAARPPRGTLHLPAALWLSTAMIVGVSVTFPRALRALRREKQPLFRKWIVATLVLACGFVMVQTPAMIQLLATHRQILEDYQHTPAAHESGSAPAVHLYGFVFVLVLLHATHVLGGIVSLIVVTVRGYRGAYDHEDYLPVIYAAMYWHFLDAVWIVMFVTFLALG